MPSERHVLLTPRFSEVLQNDIVGESLQRFPRPEKTAKAVHGWSTHVTPRKSEVLIRVVTPTLQILSAAVASAGPAALRQRVAMPFCAANMPRVACASLVLCAAVPLNLYRLKTRETQSTLKSIVFISL
jgi:hypothetical protein